MRIALRYMGKKHKKRELPEVISVCNKNTVQTCEPKCECIGKPPRFTKIHLKNVPFGKRYFDCDPCKGNQCDPLIAKRASLDELRRFYGFRCCPECNY